MSSSRPTLCTPGEGDDELLAGLRHRFELHEQEVRGRATREHQAAQRQQYGEVFSYFREGAALAAVVSDEVGVVLGKLKAVSAALKVPVVAQLVDELYVALEKQLVTFYNEMRESTPTTGSDCMHKDGTSSVAQRSRAASTFASFYRSVGDASQDPSQRPLANAAFDGRTDVDAVSGLVTVRQRAGRSFARSTSQLRRDSVVAAHHNDEASPPQSPLLAGRASAVSVAGAVMVAPPQPPPFVQLIKGAVQPPIPPVSQPDSQKLTLAESLSATTSLFAESLATLLRCEVVRIYLFDEHRNLRRAAEYPFAVSGGGPSAASIGDLYHGVNYQERGLAKSLFTAVCEKGLAVSGQDTRQAVTAEEVSASFGSTSSSSVPPASSIRNCLVWPIVLPSGHLRSGGMIHALNKEGFSDDERRRFTAEDESIMNHAVRLFGTMLERYPSQLFQCDVGPLICRMCYPERIPRPHLPPVIRDEVEGAERIANEALRTFIPIVIYRGPMATIYKQATRDKKVEEFASSAASSLNTMTTVEYNLDALNDLWKAGYDENVSMHQQCRMWSSKVKDLQTIIKQFVDALVVIRGMQDVGEMLMFIRSMELLIRSENSQLLIEHVNAGVDTVRKALAEQGAPPMSLTSKKDEVESLYRQRQKANSSERSISGLHVDGPAGVRGYTCDPDTKRQQIRAIDSMMEKHNAVLVRRGETVEGPQFSRETVSSAGKVIPRPPAQDGELPEQGLPSTSRRIIYSARSAAHATVLRLHAPKAERSPALGESIKSGHRKLE